MWHYAKNGQPVGPFTEVEIINSIRTGVLSPETLVWREGTTDWLRADQSSFGGLFRKIAAPARPVESGDASSVKMPRPIFQYIIMGLGAAIGIAVSRMLPGQMQLQIFFGGIAGFLCGLIPFFSGRSKNPKLAKAFLSWCCLAGCVLGALLALPLAIIFTVVILTRKPAVQS